MNMKELYDSLYAEGYHGKGINVGSDLARELVGNYGKNFKSILDIGCSQGLAVQTYQELGKTANGLDISEIAIEKSKELGINGCYCGSVVKTPFLYNQFDAVVSTDVLEHLLPEDIPGAVMEILRITKKYLFLRISDQEEKKKKWVKMLHEKSDDYNEISNLHTSVFTHDEWIEFFEENDGAIYLGERFNTMIFKVNKYV